MSALEDKLSEYVVEAALLREQLAELPGSEATPGQIHEYLLDVRRRLDRVETIHASVIKARGTLRRHATRLTAEADDAWDAAIMRVRAAPTRQGDEYTSAKERAAEANLLVLPARRAARKAAENAAAADSAIEALRLLHRGLDGARQDALALLRLIQFESHLER